MARTYGLFLGSIEDPNKRYAASCHHPHHAGCTCFMCFNDLWHIEETPEYRAEQSRELDEYLAAHGVTY